MYILCVPFVEKGPVLHNATARLIFRLYDDAGWEALMLSVASEGNEK